MTIIVKKPFEPFDVKSEGIKDINVKDINAANRVEQVHPEFEEKPIMATTQTSEETHGGSELTFSLPNSSQSNEQEQQQNGTSSPNNADTNNDNAADNSDNKGDQEQQNADGEKSNDNNETSDADRQSNEGGGNNTQEPQSTATDTNQSAQEQENANAESGEGNQDGEDGNGDNDTEDQGQDSNNDNESTNAEPGSSVDNGDGDTNGTNATDNDVPNQGQENDNDNEQNSENDGEDEESESEDMNEQAGTYNTQQVVDVINAVSASSKYYQTEFWRFIELIAEEKTRTFDPMSSEEYNVKKLMFRQIERKPLSHYKMSRVRESVVILLDNSGSMRWWSDNLQILADLAMQRNDVEVYLAPNGHIEEMLYPKYQLVNHDDVMKRLRNRKIIYVGDFDGADTPIILSWYNDVIWICPEGRYLNFLDHDWVHYDESRFKGAFLRVFTLQEMFDAFKKLLSMPTLRFWYDLCNETHKCGGDEE